MNKLNILFSLTSLSVVLVTLERFSPTTKILLQPHSFLRLHELVQMSLLILLTVIIPFLILRLVSNNFELLKSKSGFYWSLIFIVGIYFYSTGNGVHEISSFNFNNFCDVKNFSGSLCEGFFINDYYTGNIFYFLGAVMLVLPLLFLETLNPNKSFKKKDLLVMIINSLIYSLAIFAYAGFDRVLVGLVYSLVVMMISLSMFVRVDKDYLKYPIISYTALTYTIGTTLALIFRVIQN